jgi:type VI secretion system secreted protein Hcp
MTTTKRLFAASTTLALLFAARVATAQTVAIYMNIPGIPGDATDAQHKDWIEVEAAGQGLSNPLIAGPAGLVTGKATFQPVKVVKRIDRSSPLLFLGAAQGKQFPTITIQFVRTTADRPVFFEIKLTNALITSVSTTGADSDLPKELVGLAFAKIEWTFTEIGADGAPAGTVKGSWNVELNKAS